MSSKAFNLLFFGSDKFSIRVLQNLLKRGICPVQVVTNSNSQLGRFSRSSRLIQHPWPLTLSKQTRELSQANIGLVASFGHLIDANTTNSLKHGLFNVHPSLLPKYRGSTPIQTAIMNDDRTTGCTIMRIPPVEKFDIGDIVIQESLAINRGEYARDLCDRLADLGSDLAIQVLLNYEDCLARGKPQPSEGVTYARKIAPEAGHIKFKSETAQDIDRKVRALTETVDLYMTYDQGKKCRLSDMMPPEEVKWLDLDFQLKLHRKVNALSDDFGLVPPGYLFYFKFKKLLCIRCADNQWVVFSGVTPENKAPMKAIDFFNGFLSKLPEKRRITDL